MSKVNIAIKKDNLILIYGRARLLSFSNSTIKAAFRKTGIHPLNPAVLSNKLFAPALTTTHQSAQPVPASAPTYINALIEPIEAFENLEMTADNNAMTYKLTLLDMPPPTPSNLSYKELHLLVDQHRKLLEQANQQIAADHAQKVLMDQENGQLRKQLFLKTKEKEGSRALTSSARVLTHNESQLHLQIHRNSERMKVAHEALVKAVAARTKRIEDAGKEQARAVQLAAQAEMKARRERERLERQQQKEAEKQAARAEREAKRQRKLEEKAAGKQNSSRRGRPSQSQQSNSAISTNLLPQEEKENTHRIPHFPSPSIHFPINNQHIHPPISTIEEPGLHQPRQAFQSLFINYGVQNSEFLHR